MLQSAGSETVEPTCPTLFTSGNLRKTSGTDCPGTERPQTHLNNQPFVFPLGSNIFSTNLFTHSFRTPPLSPSLFLRISVFLSHSFYMRFDAANCRLLDSEAYLPAASEGKQAAYSKELDSDRMEKGRRRMEWGKTRVGRRVNSLNDLWISPEQIQSSERKHNMSNGENCFIIKFSSCDLWLLSVRCRVSSSHIHHTLW